MSGVCGPGWGEESWRVLPRVSQAVALLEEAKAELRTAFPAVWRGPGSEAYTSAVHDILVRAITPGALLRAAERPAALADADLALVAGGRW